MSSGVWLMGGIVVRLISGGEGFLWKLYGQRLRLVFGCGFFFGLGVVGLLFFLERLDG